MALQVEHLAPSLGSLVNDVDLGGDIARIAEDLRTLLAERQVLFFRDQRISPRAHVALAGVFGAVAPVASTFARHGEDDRVEILRSAGRRTGTDVWHSDLSFVASPPRGACLIAVESPAVGGDTMWASMTAAFDSLAPTLRAHLTSLTATHHWECPELLASIRYGADPEARLARMRLEHPPIEKPVVAKHPRTGRSYIDVNALYTIRINGVPQRESAALLDMLCALPATPEWQVRFRWRPDSVAIWDNLATQHYAINDYHPFPRLMHRVAFHEGASA